MATALPFTNTKKELHFPKLATFYDNFAQPVAWVALRLTVGVALVVQAIPLLKDPMSMASFLEGIGFYPGNVWSPVLMVIQVLGGVLIALGLYTRPAAFAVGIMMLITLWYFITHPFGGSLLTREGIQTLTGNSGLLTSDGFALLSDGGRSFVELAQMKAVLTSLLWSGAAFLFAAFGGGYMSIDRKMLRKRY